MIEAIIFYVFAFMTITTATVVVTVRNPIHAALFLVLTFFTSAVIWMTLEAEFLAITLVLVYVGAVMVLFLFVVMMLDINIESLNKGFVDYLPMGLLVAVAMAAELLTVIWAKDRFGVGGYPDPVPHAQGFSNTAAIGERLYTQFLLPFEVAGIILLVAIISAVALTLRKRPDVKTQIPAQQIRVKRDERVRLVSMPSEPTDTGRGD